MSPLYIIKLFISLNLFISRTTCSCHTSFRTHLFFSSYQFVFFLFRVFFSSRSFSSPLAFFISAFDLNLFISFLSVSFLHIYFVPISRKFSSIILLSCSFLTIFSNMFSTQKDSTDSNSKCRYLLSKKLTSKGTMLQVFYLSETPLPSYDPILPPPYTLYTRTQYTYSHREGGGGGRANNIEGQRGNIKQNREKIQK